ncbi:MAG: hypothetical protein VKJ87_00900 [Synechococcus sp.]|nr:hypothetical protein [Synechococcus sp.]
MAPFFGVPMPATPPAEVRACLKTQLGFDQQLSDGDLDRALAPGSGQVSKEELEVAQRFCSTLQ